LGGGLYFKAYLSKDNSEVANNINENDPLNYMAYFEDGKMSEEYASLSVKPSNPMYYCEQAKMRKVSIKNVDYAKLVARFLRLKEFIKANGDLKLKRQDGGYSNKAQADVILCN
jgi:hypothetical protein